MGFFLSAAIRISWVTLCCYLTLAESQLQIHAVNTGTEQPHLNLPMRGILRREFSCLELGGSGDLDHECICKGVTELPPGINELRGAGNLTMIGGTLWCNDTECRISISINGTISLDRGSSVEGGTISIESGALYVGDSSKISAKGLGCQLSKKSKGKAFGSLLSSEDAGSGGGYGGEGASCTHKVPAGGASYGWEDLTAPSACGSRGAPSAGGEGGGAGGGRINITCAGPLTLYGQISADGNPGGAGGGGSGGSIIITAKKYLWEKSGLVSASGGSGYGGGGGGRVALNGNIDEGVNVLAAGGSSAGCPENAGGAGTIFNSASGSLVISNAGLATATPTPLGLFPKEPGNLWDHVVISNHALAMVSSDWFRIQLRSKLSLLNKSALHMGVGEERDYVEVAEVVAPEVRLSSSVLKVSGSLTLSADTVSLNQSSLVITHSHTNGATWSTLDVDNLYLQAGSLLHSSGDLAIRGQGSLTSSASLMTADRLLISIFSSVALSDGGDIQAPAQSPESSLWPNGRCGAPICTATPEGDTYDCSTTGTSIYSLKVCRVEELFVGGRMSGSIIKLRPKHLVVDTDGSIDATGQGCAKAAGPGRGYTSESGAGGGAGHGGSGGTGSYQGQTGAGGDTYGDPSAPCEMGSGGGESLIGDGGSGGGVIVIGTQEHPVDLVDLRGAILASGADSRSFNSRPSSGQLANPSSHASRAPQQGTQGMKGEGSDSWYLRHPGAGEGAVDEPGGGGGSGGSIMLYVNAMRTEQGSVIAADGGDGGEIGGGGGAGGLIHFVWAFTRPPMYQRGNYSDYSVMTSASHVSPGASAQAAVVTAKGGLGQGPGLPGGDGILSTVDCPPGRFGLFCEACPVGTYKGSAGSDKKLCLPCPTASKPHHSEFVPVEGGVKTLPCPYRCSSLQLAMPSCNTHFEDAIAKVGGPFAFAAIVCVVMLLLSLPITLSRVLCRDGGGIDRQRSTDNFSLAGHSVPFLESLNEAMESLRIEQSHNLLHRLYFVGCNSFGQPWKLPLKPPREVENYVFEDAYVKFAETCNGIASFHWWEESVFWVLWGLCYPLSWTWQQWCGKQRAQRLHHYIKHEYVHSCLRSCRARALQEGLQFGCTPDHSLAYIGVYLQGDEPRRPPAEALARLPFTILFAGDGSYMLPYQLVSDDVITSFVGQILQPLIWSRLVAGLNARLRNVDRQHMQPTLAASHAFLDTHAKDRLASFGVKLEIQPVQTLGATSHWGLVLSRLAPPSSSLPISMSSTPPTSVPAGRASSSFTGRPFSFTNKHLSRSMTAQLPAPVPPEPLGPGRASLGANPSQMMMLALRDGGIDENDIHSDSKSNSNAGVPFARAEGGASSASINPAREAGGTPSVGRSDWAASTPSTAPPPSISTQAHHHVKRSMSVRVAGSSGGVKGPDSPLHGPGLTVLVMGAGSGANSPVSARKGPAPTPAVAAAVVAGVAKAGHKVRGCPQPRCFAGGLFLRRCATVGNTALSGLALFLILVLDLAATFLMLWWLLCLASPLPLVAVLMTPPLALLVSLVFGIQAVAGRDTHAAPLLRLYALWNRSAFASTSLALSFGVLLVLGIWGDILAENSKEDIITSKSTDGVILPSVVMLLKLAQAMVIGRHLANLEVEDATLLSPESQAFWAI
eukprot:jgi/Mesvir1/5888/Mv00660-RA.1